ncbi:MAG: hypothetical protein QM323_09535 [Acidobacteriota bacterium]|nr:hypothetical protein [Acidobacteriota bacterium]
MDEPQILRCEWYGCEIRRGRRGLAPRYCGSACRVAAHRVRRTTAAIHAELETAGAARMATVHRAPTLAASSDEQVARAFVEARSLGGVFARLSLEAR